MPVRERALLPPEGSWSQTGIGGSTFTESLIPFHPIVTAGNEISGRGDSKMVGPLVGFQPNTGGEVAHPVTNSRKWTLCLKISSRSGVIKANISIQRRSLKTMPRKETVLNFCIRLNPSKGPHFSTEKETCENSWGLEKWRHFLMWPSNWL